MLKPIFCAALAVAAMLLASHALADEMDLVNTSHTVDASGGVSINRLELKGPGTLTVTLTSIPWPQSLAQVAMLLTTLTGTVEGHMDGFNTESFRVNGAETLYAFCFGRAERLPGFDFGYGTYGLWVHFKPQAPAVPIPPSFGLLGAGLLGLALWRRRPSPRRRLGLPVLRTTNAAGSAILL